MQQRLALFDLDGTLADRQSAHSDAVTGFSQTHVLASDAERWLRTELADRANAADFARLREAFDLEVPAASSSRCCSVVPTGSQFFGLNLP
ncbi:HAD family hydrolase [Streptomyces sp. NPDC047082]|uniref:HAD family hydrolase n=1 Tax=Streptomyces sp. NPDC047082 TaxID=3155259 RepID=UPI0033ED8109